VILKHFHIALLAPIIRDSSAESVQIQPREIVSVV